MELELTNEAQRRKRQRRMKASLRKTIQGIATACCSIFLSLMMLTQSGFAFELDDELVSEEAVEIQDDVDGLTEETVELGESAEEAEDVELDSMNIGEQLTEEDASSEDEIQTTSFEIDDGDAGDPYRRNVHIQGDYFSSNSGYDDEFTMSLDSNRIEAAHLSISAFDANPDREVESEWWSIGSEAKYAPDNFTVTSTNEVVVQADYAYDAESWEGTIRFEAKSVGSAVVTISYNFRSFYGEESIEVNVLSEENRIASFEKRGTQYEVWAHECASYPNWVEPGWGDPLAKGLYCYRSQATDFPASSMRSYGGHTFDTQIGCTLLHEDSLSTKSYEDQIEVTILEGASIADPRIRTREVLSSDKKKLVVDGVIIMWTAIAQGETTVRVSLKDNPTQFVDMFVNVHTEEPDASDATLRLTQDCRIGWLSYPSSVTSDEFVSFCEHVRASHSSDATQKGIFADVSVTDMTKLKPVCVTSRAGYPWLLVPCGIGQTELVMTDQAGVPHACKVTIEPHPSWGTVEAVSLNHKKISIALGEPSLGLVPSIVSNGSNYLTGWQSSDDRVVNYYYWKELRPVGEGTCLVWFIAGDKVAVCEVEVRAAEAIPTKGDSGHDVKVEVPYGDSEAIKEISGLSLSITKKAQDASLNSFLNDLKNSGASVLGAYDIHFENADGDVHEWPSSKGVTFRIKIPLTDEMKSSMSGDRELKVYYVNDETGDREAMKTWIEGGNLCFETTHFSTYAIVSAPKSIVGDGSQQDGGDNGSSNEWVSDRNPSYGDGDRSEGGDATFQGLDGVNTPQTQQASVTANGQADNATKQVAQPIVTAGVTGSDTTLSRTGDAMQSMLLALITIALTVLILSLFGKNASVKAAASSGARPSLSEREKRRTKGLK